jgi:hypothetical protein
MLCCLPLERSSCLSATTGAQQNRSTLWFKQVSPGRTTPGPAWSMLWHQRFAKFLSPSFVGGAWKLAYAHTTLSLLPSFGTRSCRTGRLARRLRVVALQVVFILELRRLVQLVLGRVGNNLHAAAALTPDYKGIRLHGHAPLSKS